MHQKFGLGRAVSVGAFLLATTLNQLLGLVVEDGDEFVSNDLSFFLRIGDPCELREKALACVDGDQIQSKPVAKIGLNFLEFVLSQHAVIDENAGKPISDCTIHQNGRYRRVHATRQRAYSMAFADSFSNRRNRLVNEALRSPRGFSVTDIEDEIP